MTRMIPQSFLDIDASSMGTESLNRDFAFSIQIARWVSMPIGIWPLQLQANIFKRFIFEFLVVIFAYFLIFFSIVSCGMYTLYTETNTRSKIKMIGPMSFYFFTIAKYSFLLGHRDKIRKCLKHMDLDWQRFKASDDREVMLINARAGRFVGGLCACFMYAGGIFYRTILPLTTGTKVIGNVTIRPLICRVYEPIFGGRLSPSYELCFAGQWLSGFVAYSVTITACNLAATFVLHACGQLKIIMFRLDDFVEGKKNDKSSIDERIAEIVELHLSVLRFIFRFKSTLNEICLVEICGCTWHICILGYYLLTEVALHAGIISSMTMGIFFTSVIFNIFIFCYIGEILTQQGKEIGAKVWMIEWYRLPDKRARDMILLLAMSNYPTSLTAGKMFELSYASFCSVLKTAAAYFNFIWTITA